MAAAKLSKHSCALCGRRLPEGTWLYSRFTGNRFCTGARTKSCEAIHAKRKKQQQR